MNAKRAFFALFLVATCLAQVANGLAAAPFPRFIAVTRSNSEAWLMPEAGDVLFVQRGDAQPVVGVTLRDASGAPYRWDAPPSAFARWRDGWWVSNGSTRLRHFGMDGRLVGLVAAPVGTTELTAAGDTLWIYSSLPGTMAGHLWWSADGGHFTAVPFHIVDDAASTPAKVLSLQLVLAASRQNEIAIAHVIGGAKLDRLQRNGAPQSISLAYLRSRARSSLEVFHPGQDDVLAYSAPVRDIEVLDDRSIVALRNREDVRRGAAMALEQGRRIDRYDAHGRHVGTAILSENGKFLLRASAQEVSVLADSGRILRARFGAPLAGGVTP